jgi:hypothetical protein
MFHPAKTEEAITKASLQLIANSPFDLKGKAIFKPGFYLQRHSIDQVIQANDHLARLLDEEGKQKRAFNVEEIRWIRNERALCRCDFVYWASRYGFIIDWVGQLVRFNPNIAQRIALGLFSELEEQDVAILVMFLKARQLGVTTIAELIMLWMAMFFPRANILVASSDPDKSAQMAKKMVLCYQNQPYWMVPEITAYHQGELIEFDKQKSAITIAHGTQHSGLARGSTPTAFHLSEVSDYTNPEWLIDASLLRAVHDSPWVIGLLESTAAGRNNYWHRTWNESVAGFTAKRSRLCPGFLPWYVGTDIYPTEAWKRRHPLAEDYHFEDATLKHARRAEEYVNSGRNPLLTKALGSNWIMPREQMYFWELEREAHQRKKILHLFYQELCADDMEAFQSSNISVYNVEIISSYSEACRPPIGVYGILAPQTEVPVQLQAKHKEIDPNHPAINIRCKWHNMQPAHDYTLVPLLHFGPATFDPLGKILIYEMPKDGEIYGLGTDTGFGLGEDRSVLQVLRKGSATRNDEQVLEFASPYVNSFSLWPFNLAIGTLYSTIVNNQRRQAKQVIELAANGENVVNELRKRGWSNFHMWVRYDRKRVNEARATRIGWYTTTWSRRMMMDMLLDATMNGWLDINSPWFVDEMADLELEMENQKIKAVGGAHDDRIMAIAMVLFSLHAMETRNNDHWLSRLQGERTNPNPQYATYSPGAQGLENFNANYGPPASYAYRVVNPNTIEEELLRPAGASIWTPDDY